MSDFWQIQIRRAERLAAERSEAGELLTFYAGLLRAQEQVYDHVRTRQGWTASGLLEKDLGVIRPMLSLVFETVESNGPDLLREQARQLKRGGDVNLDELLLEHWRHPSDVHFFSKALLQPYARWLADANVKPSGRTPDPAENRCPFCAGRPQVSVLIVQEPDSEAGGRSLVCSTCLTAWAFRRVVCASCGEERPSKLGYFQAEEYDHVRIEACDTCKHYLKGIDLTRLGIAVPLVDEVAAAPLDLWARERGYTKVELNLVGV